MTLCPQSCDTFVVMPSCTKDGLMVFGKNSDRPCGEVQDLLHIKEHGNKKDAKLQCTYISIDDVPHINGVALSKPNWMWGAEMGVNHRGVCIGNEAIWTNIEIDDTRRLLGMDLVRLGLERASTARTALHVITDLLAIHGQGGPCGQFLPDFSYHNSFLIADGTEAWVLETAGPMWVAERVTTRYRHISNCLSIETHFDLKSENLEENAEALGLWNGSEEFNFKKIFEKVGSDNSRIECGKVLLDHLTRKNDFDVRDMFNILRNTDSGICRGLEHDNPTAGSMVSILHPANNSQRNVHFLTGTPDPRYAVFKPFYFTQSLKFCFNNIETVHNKNAERYEPPKEFYNYCHNNRAYANDLLVEKVLAFLNHKNHEEIRLELLEVENELLDLASKYQQVADLKQPIQTLDQLFSLGARKEFAIYRRLKERTYKSPEGINIKSKRAWYNEHCARATALKRTAMNKKNKQEKNLNRHPKCKVKYNTFNRSISVIFSIASQEYVVRILKNRELRFD